MRLAELETHFAEVVVGEVRLDARALNCSLLQGNQFQLCPCILHGLCLQSRIERYLVNVDLGLL